jgi:hypothetical protein
MPWALNEKKKKKKKAAAQLAVHERYRNITKHRFREATWKLPRRWQFYITQEGNILS